MPKNQRHNIMLRSRSGWIKWLLGIVGGLVFAMLVTFAIAKFRLIPLIVHQEVVQGLSKFWDGQIELESTQVNFFAPIYLRGITLSDKNGHQWLHTKVAKLTLANWPGLSPTITKIDIDGFNLHIPPTAGVSTLPLHRQSRQGRALTGHSRQPANLKSKLDIQELTIREAAITVLGTQGSKVVYDNLTLSATRKENFYEVLLNSAVPETSELLIAKGTINPRGFETDLSLQMKHTVKKDEMAVIFAALNMPKLSTEGKLAANLSITGPIEKPAGLQTRGTIKLNDWAIAIKDKVITTNLTTMAKLDGQRFNFEKFTANICKGYVNGSFYANVRQNQPTQLGGKIIAQKISLPEFTSALTGQNKKATKGTASVSYNFTASSSELKTLQGDGLIFLDDADISVFPVIPHLFAAIGLASYDPLKMSDAQATFTMAGPVATIKSGHIANSFAAIEAEPGGTINLQTGRIDMHVIAIPLRQIDALIKRIPIIKLLANLKDKLTRLYIKGHWSDPPSKLITKEPIKDIEEGTVGFIQDVARTGGQFSQDLLKKLGILFQSKENPNK